MCAAAAASTYMSGCHVCEWAWRPPGDHPATTCQEPCGAVVGVGFFAENHLHAWQELNVPIHAICDVDAERLKLVMFFPPHCCCYL